MESLINLYHKVVDVTDSFFKKTDGNLNVFGKIFTIFLIFLIISIIVKVSKRIIDRTMINGSMSRLEITDRRRNTLANIIKKLVKYILFFIGIVMSLELFNINTASIIATAGIGGLAIGFGAQSLVKDIITGFFILLEDQYSVGDYVQIDTKEGIVEELGVRVTKVRDFSGELHIIPNSSITIVTNKTRGVMRALVEIPIPYDADIDKAIQIMEETSRKLAQNNENIVEGPYVLGVVGFGSSDIVLRAMAMTKSMQQWTIEREMRKQYKQAFDKEGIQIPYSKLIVYGGEEQ